MKSIHQYDYAYNLCYMTQDSQRLKLEPGQTGIPAVGYCSNGHLATLSGWAPHKTEQLFIPRCHVGLFVDLHSKKLTFWVNQRCLNNQLQFKELWEMGKPLYVTAMLDGPQELKVLRVTTDLML